VSTALLCAPPATNVGEAFMDCARRRPLKKRGVKPNDIEPAAVLFAMAAAPATAGNEKLRSDQLRLTASFVSRHSC
jgi:hypothetical protein